MWGDIILSIVTSVGEAACTSYIEKKKLGQFNGKIEKSVSELFDEFADTSLDSNDFGGMISNITFIEMLRNYFCTLNDRLSNEEYLDKFEAYIISKAPKSKTTEVRRFLKKFEGLYYDVLKKVIDENYELNALFQMITVSHRELIGKIIESEENLYKYITSLENKKVSISEEEIKAYHSICNSEYGYIKFTGISGVENKKQQRLNDFYVENTFSYYGKDFQDIYECDSDQFEPIQIGDFFNYTNKVIIIGGAGLGKSTTLNYLFCNYEIIYGSIALKLKIDLKEYAKDISEDKKDILWCLCTEFAKRISKGKIEFCDIEKNVADYLERGKCLVILDALDEIPTQATRNKVRDEIARFSNIYFSNRMIISTREAGYLKNRFDDSFLHIKINDFNDIQLEKYSYNWYRINYNEITFDDFWLKFNQEVERSKCIDIIRNPIVLILALVIFDIEKNLPNRRVEFYKKCIETFLEVRENRKAAFTMDREIKNILGDNSVVPKIAFYKFEKIKEDLGYKFTKEELHSAIMNAIEVTDTRNWIDPVKNYAGYLVDRTELIKEIDENQYDFAHKTFYEYFLAVYFSKECDHTDLVELLRDWIGDSNYDELARLIIEVIIDKNDSSQHKKLISFMFEEINKFGDTDSIDQEKMVDIFSIIADLYKNEQLLIKFHDLYNRCILYHSRLVNQVKYGNRYGRKENAEVVYDSVLLAEMFTDILAKSEGQLIGIIESLFYLDDEFRNEVVKTNNGIYQYVTNLYKWIEEYCSNNKKPRRKIEKTKMYFINEGKDLLLSIPSIYVSYICALCSQKDYEIDEELFEFTFPSINRFTCFTMPEVLYQIIADAFISWKHMLLCMICLIHCAEGSTNWLLQFRRHEFYRKRIRKEEKRKYLNDVLNLWELFNKTSDFDNFIGELEKKEVCNQKYMELYIQLYTEYQTKEKDNNSVEIERWLTEEME